MGHPSILRRRTIVSPKELISSEHKNTRSYPNLPVLFFDLCLKEQNLSDSSGTIFRQKQTTRRVGLRVVAPVSASRNSAGMCAARCHLVGVGKFYSVNLL